MSNYQYAQLCQMLEEMLANEPCRYHALTDARALRKSVLQTEPPCDFEENEIAFDNENYSELWEDRS